MKLKCDYHNWCGCEKYKDSLRYYRTGPNEGTPIAVQLKVVHMVDITDQKFDTLDDYIKNLNDIKESLLLKGFSSEQISFIDGYDSTSNSICVFEPQSLENYNKLCDEIAENEKRYIENK